MENLIKRCEYVFFYHKNGKTIDIVSLLSGKIKFNSDNQFLALPILHGEEIPIVVDEFLALSKIPTDEWIVEQQLNTEVKPETLSRLKEYGLVLEKNKKPNQFSERETKLCDQKWNIYAALYHFMTKWKSVNVDLQLKHYEGEENIELYHDSMNTVVEAHGNPPHHFHNREGKEEFALPIIKEEKDPFYELLIRRKTSRVFDRDTPLSLEKLNKMLYYVFGCYGYYKMQDKLWMLKKSSPSGGSLHPTEAYILILNVEKLSPGLYHYNVEKHSLVLLKEYTREQAEEHANVFTAGQNYPKDASALFVMTSRFFRNFWKYQQHTISYKVLLFDAGHLSQTFYLTAAKLELGAFVTGAINASHIEEELSIDGFEEGATLVCGCGIPLSTHDKNLLEPEFYPYEPPR